MVERYGRLLLCLMLLGGSALARPLPPEKVLFYYPIAVGGEITRAIDQRVAEFEAMHPGIDIEPVYSGTYKESLAKVLAANRAGAPPTLAVLFAVDMHTLLDADAIVPFEALIGAGDRSWLDDFEPAFMANSRAGSKTWGIPFQRSAILRVKDSIPSPSRLVTVRMTNSAPVFFSRVRRRAFNRDWTSGLIIPARSTTGC